MIERIENLPDSASLIPLTRGTFVIVDTNLLRMQIMKLGTILNILVILSFVSLLDIFQVNLHFRLGGRFGRRSVCSMSDRPLFI